jgi:hypothetical protein
MHLHNVDGATHFRVVSGFAWDGATCLIAHLTLARLVLRILGLKVSKGMRVSLTGLLAAVPSEVAIASICRSLSRLWRPIRGERTNKYESFLCDCNQPRPPRKEDMPTQEPFVLLFAD